ncbi:unnamed protein product [Trichobilharzia szidati]|nr:unnamed protein product [Trichobilharzia szidati]
MAKRIPNNRCVRSLDDSEDLISSTNDGSQPISQNVQDLANDIYKEFESLIKLYGNGFLHNLMPLVIRALENLDSLHLENSDLHLKLLVLSDDHKLLSSEYEKEKKLRKVAENRLFHLEDDLEEERKNHEEKCLAFESNIRLLEGKVKNYNEQISRYEDHELEMKKDYQRLHDLYTNLLRAYLEYVERVRSMFHKYKLDHQCLPHAPYLTDNTSFEVSSPTQTSDRSTGVDQLNRFGAFMDSDALETERQRIMRMIMETTPELYGTGGLLTSSTLSEPCFDELSQGDLPDDDGHDMKSHDGSCTASQPQCGETLGSDFAESVELEVDGDLTDYAGVRREVQNLIKENQELIQTKNALKIVTNDLIGKIDELSCQNFQFSSELNALITNRASMLLRIKDLEQENGQLRREFENPDLYGSLPGDETNDCEDLPLSMRVRFSRVEMARVLLERNQYKEQLLELQEAVHLAHNLKAEQVSRLQNGGNKRGRIRAFFARLFNSPVQTQQNSSKLYTPPLALSMMNTRQSATTAHNFNSSSRLSIPTDSTTSSLLSDRSDGNVSVSFQKTTSEICLNQDLETPRTSARMTYNSSSLNSFSNSNQNANKSLDNHRQLTASSVEWYSSPHGNEYHLERRNPQVTCIYPLDNYPDSIELRCAAVAYPYQSVSSMPATSLLTTSSPSMEDNIHNTVGYSTRNSVKSIDDNVGNTNGNDACTDVSRCIDGEYKEDHHQVQQLNNNGLSCKSLNNYSMDNLCSGNSLEKYPSMIVDDDDFPDIRSNMIWLCSLSMKQDLATFKPVASNNPSSSSSSIMHTSSEYSARIKSLITIVRMDNNSACQIVDSFAICSSTVLCICAVPGASGEDFSSLKATQSYWEMLPMDMFDDASETAQPSITDLNQGNTSCPTNESSIITEFKYLDCDSNNNNNNHNESTPQRTDKLVESNKHHKTSTPMPTVTKASSSSTNSHLSSIKQALDHLSSTRRLVNALGIVGSVNDVDEVTMSYVATRRRFIVRHLDCDTDMNVTTASKDMLSHRSSTTISEDIDIDNDDIEDNIDSQCACSSSTQPHRQHHHHCSEYYSNSSELSNQPTMWLGCQNGDLYVHSCVSDWRKCLHAIRLPDSVTQICHFAGRVFVSLANGQIVVFRRQLFSQVNQVKSNLCPSHSTSIQSLKTVAAAAVTTTATVTNNNNNNDVVMGSWDFTEACVITCGRPQCSVKCTITIPPTNSVWAAYRNRILVINAFTLQLVDCFKVHAIQDSQVQTMTWYKDGVWMSIRRESILRLYHVISHELIQTVDLNQTILSLVLSNSNKPEYSDISSKVKSPSFAVSTLKAMNDRLWIGTSVGLIVTIHFQDGLFNRTFQRSSSGRQKDSIHLSKRICKAILDCSSVQISVHQHTTPVRFFVSPTVVQQHSEDSANIQSNCKSLTPYEKSSASQKSSDPLTSNKHKKRMEKSSVFIVSGAEGHVISNQKDDSKNKSNKGSTTDHNSLDQSHLILWKL